jgi:hypothetical protein
MKYQRHIGATDIVLECNPLFEHFAKDIFNKLEQFIHQGKFLNNGFQIQYSWSVLTLQASSPGLLVCEPDFYGDALHDFNENLDTTFGIIAEQVTVLRETDLKGMDVYFSDEVFINGNALHAPNLFLKRQRPGRPGDSGWYIGNINDLEAGNEQKSHEILRVFELLSRRQSLLKVLSLPVDYVVTMENDSITGILGPGGKNLWIENQ